jgi:hypothetical protein
LQQIFWFSFFRSIGCSQTRHRLRSWCDSRGRRNLRGYCGPVWVAWNDISGCGSSAALRFLRTRSNPITLSPSARAVSRSHGR